VKGCKRELLLSTKFLYLIGREKVCVVSRTYSISLFVFNSNVIVIFYWNFPFCSKYYSDPFTSDIVLKDI